MFEGLFRIFGRSVGPSSDRRQNTILVKFDRRHSDRRTDKEERQRFAERAAAFCRNYLGSPSRLDRENT